MQTDLEQMQTELKEMREILESIDVHYRCDNCGHPGLTTLDYCDADRGEDGLIVGFTCQCRECRTEVECQIL